MELVIGTRRWSTWSLRPWLVLKRTGASFQETLVGLRQDEGRTEAEILPHSPSGLVPALKDGGLTVWDSLAICEYLAEKFPQAKLWPDDPQLRALARAASAEMHSGFQSLRGECPMALEVEPKVTALSEATQKNIRRIVSLWNGLLKRSGGPYLADRRRVLYAGRHALPDLWRAPVGLWRRWRVRRLCQPSAGDAGVPRMGSGREGGGLR